MMICCSKCGVSAMDSMLYRSNPKGEAPIWRCEKCLGQMVDKNVKAIGAAIVADNQKRGAE